MVIFAGSNAGMETSASLFSDIVTNALFHSSPRINQTLPHITDILHLWLVAELCPDFVINWSVITAVRRPRDERMAVGFIQLLRTVTLRASFQTFQIKIAACDNHYRGLGEDCLSPYLARLIVAYWPAVVAECQLLHRSLPVSCPVLPVTWKFLPVAC